jgi:cell wall-associated NlpC family hydrolase
LIRRLMALTSSVLFAAGTTPWPMATNASQATPTPKPSGQKPRQSTNSADSQFGYDVDALSVTRMLRRQHRLHEVHYAVADNAVVPILQDQMIYKLLAQKRRLWLEHQADKAGPTRRGATPHKPRRLSARSGGVDFQSTSFSFGIRIAKVALSLVGSPYRWGGTSEAGFDCSGFTQYVFRELGTVLPRTSYDQFMTGTAVSRSSLLPGDLVFFSTDEAGASHVAIYVGNGLIVHALNHRTGVIVSRLSDEYYASRYIGARRHGI